MNLNALKIDLEFQGKIPPLNAEEEHILEQNMIQERRLLNPLIIWNGYILDGHSRYRILKHHPEIAFEVKEIQLPDRYAALAWICQNQLGRRNLDPERRKFLMGKAYESQKLSDWGENPQNRNKQSGRFAPCGQNDHMDTHLRTCEKIAQANGVSPKFVRRAEKYANGIDAAEAAVPGAMEEILTGHIKATDAEITALAQTPKEEIPAIIRGDIYYADMEPHIGSEQGGTRPVVVLQNDIGNRYAPTLIVATVTSRTEKKRYQPTHVLIAHNTVFEKPSVVQLEQIFTIDKSRVQRFLGRLTQDEMQEIEKGVVSSLDLNELFFKIKTVRI